jgi:uncharacterized protein YkwD
MKTKLLTALLPLAFVFTMVSCSPTDQNDPSERVAVVDSYSYNTDEFRLRNLINDYRQSVGLPLLQTINHVSYKSFEHNEYMIAHQVVNHDLFYERAQNIRAAVGAVKVNENIAYNFPTPEAALAAWLASPGHKDNIEGNFTHFGISVTEDPVAGKKYYTNIFVKIN